MFSFGLEMKDYCGLRWSKFIVLRFLPFIWILVLSEGKRIRPNSNGYRTEIRRDGFLGVFWSFRLSRSYLVNSVRGKEAQKVVGPTGIMSFALSFSRYFVIWRQKGGSNRGLVNLLWCDWHLTGPMGFRRVCGMNQKSVKHDAMGNICVSHWFAALLINVGWRSRGKSSSDGCGVEFAASLIWVKVKLQKKKKKHWKGGGAQLSTVVVGLRVTNLWVTWKASLECINMPQLGDCECFWGGSEIDTPVASPFLSSFDSAEEGFCWEEMAEL